MRRGLILVAEDCPDDRLLLKDALEQSRIKCRIEMVENGQLALDYVIGYGAYKDRRRFPLPDALLLDLKMPVKDGFQTLEELRRDHFGRLLPVIVLSASALPQDIERAYGLGANAYIVKPTGLAELTEMMSVVVAFWLGYNRSPLVARSS